MKPGSFKNFSIILLIVLVLTSLVIYGVSRKKAGLSDQNSETPAENQTYMIFTTPDNKFSVAYPASWLGGEMVDVTKVVSEKTAEKYNLTIPFLVFGPNQINQVSVMIYSFDAQKTLPEIMEVQIKDLEENEGIKAKVLSQGVGDKEAIVEMSYETQKYNLRSKERVFLTESENGTIKGYWVSFMVLEDEWESYQDMAGYVIGSAKMDIQ
ncbi:hypothetical protein COY34_03265 [candidate division WWE3 bacterium CG_4_10_14_0_2_um_filter_42_8]|uniref:PsbP C-terminal domain-containing protein n=1 Tax=candidate division WWE3 bacterium CG_4_10_14_0_2_um_filter_42_8 TaxID=1975074 RepID=A0A2M7TBR0_UNCKA|nr:MAG: hypothetical protein COY34_03265 [candidate division WWE3 bacterium CG_4_10_14_0_2_um_filter_42_8]